MAGMVQCSPAAGMRSPLTVSPSESRHPMLDELYLVRHAEPDRGLKIPYNVPPGPPLTPRGREEAAQTAAWLAGRGVEFLFSSPFDRAADTAGAIAERLGLDVTFVEALKEGAPGESLDQIQARVAELLRQMYDGPHRRVALVSHGACIRGLLLESTGGRIDLKSHVYDNGNCAPTAGVWRGVRGEDGWRWELAFRPGATPAIQPLAGSKAEWV